MLYQWRHHGRVGDDVRLPIDEGNRHYRPYLQYWGGARWQYDDRANANVGWFKGQASSSMPAMFGQWSTFPGGQDGAFYRIVSAFYCPSSGVTTYQAGGWCEMDRLDIVITW